MDRYASLHKDPKGPGDARPTAEQVVNDQRPEWREELRGKIAFITGGSSGLGAESARVLQMAGARIFIGVRDLVKGQEVAEKISKAHPNNPPVEVVELHMDSVESVGKAAKDFLARSGNQLNIFMANAGIMACEEGKTKDGFETQFGVNHLAHFLLLKLLTPAMLSSSTESFASRVVSVSSSGHRICSIFPDNYQLESKYDPWTAYGQSKTANIYMANEIERRYGNQGLHAWSLHPGSIFETSISRHQEGGSDGLQQRMRDTFPGWAAHEKTVGQGAATQVWAAVAEELEGKGGLYLDDLQVAGEVKDDTPPYMAGYAAWAFDKAMEGRLWQDSEKIVNEFLRDE